MKKVLSTKKLAETVKSLREAKGYSLEKLGEFTGINRILIGRIEKETFIPSITQFEELGSVLGFDLTDMFIEKERGSSFVALRSEPMTDSERDGVDKLLTMMLSLRQQIKLRSFLGNEKD